MSTTTASTDNKYVHITCDLQTSGNSVNEFTCRLDREIYLPHNLTWFVSLAQLTCTKPKRNSRYDDNIVVCLDEAITGLNPRGAISCHGTGTMLDDYEPMPDARPIHSYQPISESAAIKTHLVGNVFSSFTIRLEQINELAYYMLESSAYCSLTLCIVGMNVQRKEEIPLYIDSRKTDDLPDNEQNNFSFALSQHLAHTRQREWFLSIKSVSHPTRFTMFPSHWDLQADMKVTLRMYVRRDYVGNAIDGSPILKAEHTWLRDCPFTLNSISACQNLAELCKALNAILSAGGRNSTLLTFSPSSSGRKIELTWKAGTDAVRTNMPALLIEMPIGLACILGLAGKEDLPVGSSYLSTYIYQIILSQSALEQTDAATGQRKESAVTTSVQPDVNFFIPNEIYLKCDSTEPAVMNGRTEQVVAVIPVREGRCFARPLMSGSARYELSMPYYHRLRHRQLPNLKFWLTDHDGHEISFHGGGDANERPVSIGASLRLIW